MLIGAPTFCEISERLWSMMENSIVVAYNAPFDVSFLTSEFQLCGFPALKQPVTDALAIARQLLPGLGRYPQENVANVMGIPFPVKHRALEDTMVTAQLFTAFLSMLKAYDCTTCADLNRKDLTRVLHEKRLNIIEGALSSQHTLWLKYLSPTEHEITQRMITPKECVTDKFKQNGATYLIAYCHSAKAERNFRIDRILDVRAVPSRII
jgi:DNA polymerase III alpha subunit (gram-positive type)